MDGSGWESVYSILKKGGYDSQHRSESDDILGRRRGRHPARNRCAKRPRDPGRPFLRQCRRYRERGGGDQSGVVSASPGRSKSSARSWTVAMALTGVNNVEEIDSTSW